MKTPFSRRHFIKTSTLAAGAGLHLAKLLPAVDGYALSRPDDAIATVVAPGEVSIRLLDGKALSLESGISFGVPWARGSVKPNATFRLTSEDKRLPLQSWPLAYWPDGSLKWSGFATVVPAGLKTQLILSQGTSEASGALKVTNDGKSVVVDTGALKCSIPNASATSLIDSMTVEGRAVAGEGHLVCVLQSGSETNPEDSPSRERFLSLVKKVTWSSPGRCEQW